MFVLANFTSVVCIAVYSTQVWINVPAVPWAAVGHCTLQKELGRLWHRTGVQCESGMWGVFWKECLVDNGWHAELIPAHYSFWGLIGRHSWLLNEIKKIDFMTFDLLSELNKLIYWWFTEVDNKLIECFSLFFADLSFPRSLWLQFKLCKGSLSKDSPKLHIDSVFPVETFCFLILHKVCHSTPFLGPCPTC